MEKVKNMLGGGFNPIFIVIVALVLGSIYVISQLYTAERRDDGSNDYGINTNQTKQKILEELNKFI